MSKTRLFQAVKALDLGAVKALLEANPGLRQVTDERGRNALHLVLKKSSDRKHVEMLVRYRADPRIVNREGQSALDLVARRRDRSYFDLLTSPGVGRATRKG